MTENGTKTAWIVFTGLGGASVTVVAMITFLYSQFLTLREHEEFIVTMHERSIRVDDQMKEIIKSIADMREELGHLQGQHEGGKR